MKKLIITLALAANISSLPLHAEPKAARDLPGIAEAEVVTVYLEVKKIDKETRMVTLKREDGSTVKIKAGPEVRNFAQIEKGDKVTVVYKTGTSISVEPRGKGAKLEATTTEARAALGEKPAGEVAVQAEFRTVVDAIDYDKRKITLKGPSGKKEIFTVGPEVKRFASVKKGDELVVHMLESVSITVSGK